MGDMTAHSRSRVLALDAMVAVVAPDNPGAQYLDPATGTGFFRSDHQLGRSWRSLTRRSRCTCPKPEPEWRWRSRIGCSERRKPGTGRKCAPLCAQQRAWPVLLWLIRLPLVWPALPNPAPARALTLTGRMRLFAVRQPTHHQDRRLSANLADVPVSARATSAETDAREFLRYMRSPAAQFVVRRSGFVDQAPEEISIKCARAIVLPMQSCQPDTEISLEQLQEMIQTLGPMSRLTTSFRFETGSTRPDAQSRANIAQLARAS